MIREFCFAPLGKLSLIGVLICTTAAAGRLGAQILQSASQGQATAPSTASESVGPDEVVLTVGNFKITAAEFEKIMNFLPPQYSGAANSLGKKGFADQYANLLGLSLEGEKRKIHEREDFQQAMAFQKLLLLAQLTLNDLATTAGPVNPEEVQSYYTTHKDDFEEAKVRGIYVAFQSDSGPGESGASPPQQNAEQPDRSEQEAKDKAETLRSRIQAGEDMAILAKTESDHATASQGGDFGYVRRDQMVPEMSNVIFSLQPNQLSAPVRDRFGYFIFQVEGKRAQPLEEVQPTIENNLRQQKVNELLANVRNEYPVTLNPRYFSETSPGTPPPTGPAQ